VIGSTYVFMNAGRYRIANVQRGSGDAAAGFTGQVGPIVGHGNSACRWSARQAAVHGSAGAASEGLIVGIRIERVLAGVRSDGDGRNLDACVRRLQSARTETRDDAPAPSVKAEQRRNNDLVREAWSPISAFRLGAVAISYILS
jgi:hypothetical protein